MQCSLEPEASPDGKWGPLVTRKSLMRSGLAALLVAPFTASALVAGRGQESGGSEAESSDRAEGRGATDEEIVLGVSAAFSGPSRGLGTELYRGAMAYFNHVNENGGIEGRKVSLRLYDDGYQPDPCVQNTMRLMLEDKVFSLFGYVGTPTVTRVLPILKKFQDEKIFLFFPFTGAQPQREPPYGEFAFNLRASYNQETAGLVDNLVRIGRRRIAVFYQIDAYGRSGWAGVRAALDKHGERLAGEATYSRGEKFTGSMRKTGRDPAGRRAGRRHLHRRLRRLRRVRARRRRPRVRRADRQPLLRRQ